MHIRVLTRDNASDFRLLRLKGLQDHPEAFGESAGEFAALSTEDVATRIPATGASEEGFILGAYEGDRLLGVTCLWRSSRQKSRHHATLWGMYVSGDVRRQGIGERLVRELIVRARQINGLELVKLTVASANERAWRLYEKCGFRVFGTEPKALRINGVDYEQRHMMIDLTELDDKHEHLK